MNNKNRLHRAARTHFLQKGFMAFMAVALLAVSVVSNAQEITTTVRGTVTVPGGGVAVGESVSITDTRTGSVRSTTTNDSGAFTIRGLQVGGPYTIRVQSSQYQDAQVTDVHTNLSSAVNFNIALAESNEAIEEIITVASEVQTMDMAIGPGTSFTLEEIQAMPSSARQIQFALRVSF